MGKISEIKNNGLKKIFAAGQGRRQRSLDRDQFGKQEVYDMEPLLCKVFRDLHAALLDCGIPHENAVEACRVALSECDQFVCGGDFRQADAVVMGMRDAMD